MASFATLDALWTQECERRVNNSFGAQSNHNMEFYVYDLILKNKKVSDLPIAMNETFQTIWAAEMQLNPMKCSLGAIWKMLGIHCFKIMDRG